jgi:hypothetical protein
LVRHLSWQVGSVIIRREIIKKTGSFDVNFNIGEDQEFLARVALHGPVGLLKDKLMTAHRRVETIENLSRIARTNPISSMKLQDAVYLKLESINTLSRNERRAAKWLRSANYRAIGNLLSAQGKTQEARSAYWTAVKIQPSILSIGKFALSFLTKREASPCPVALNVNQTAED